MRYSDNLLCIPLPYCDIHLKYYITPYKILIQSNGTWAQAGGCLLSYSLFLIYTCKRFLSLSSIKSEKCPKLLRWGNRTEQNMVAWTLGVIACRWDTEKITPKSEFLQCPLVRGRHSVYFWLQRSKNTRGHLPYTGGSAMPALCLTEKRAQLSREPVPWL